MKRSIRSQKLVNKTGKASCEICKELDILEIHHIRGRDIPNANHPANLTSICASCHNKIHYGMIVVEDWVMTTSGRELLWHKKNETGITGNDAKPNLLI